MMISMIGEGMEGTRTGRYTLEHIQDRKAHLGIKR